MAKRWYVVNTYSGYENKVKGDLEHRIETSKLEDKITKIKIPVEEVTEIKEGGKKVTSEHKVFPGYILVRMELNDTTWSLVRNTPGVSGFVGVDNNPVPLSREEYNKIMKVGAPEEVEPKVISDVTYEVGSMVKVISGPLSDFDGKIAEVDMTAGKLKVLVMIFGRETPVELAFDQVSKLN